jgi:hypothetical protein
LRVFINRQLKPNKGFSKFELEENSLYIFQSLFLIPTGSYLIKANFFVPGTEWITLANQQGGQQRTESYKKTAKNVNYAGVY